MVVANQVSDVIGPDEHAKVGEASHQGGERRGFGSSNENFGQGQRKEGKVAAMGLAWAQAVNSRLVLQRCRPRCLVYHGRHGVGGRDAAAGESDMEHLEPVGIRQVSQRLCPVPANRSVHTCSRRAQGQACDGVMIRQAQRARLTVGCDDASRHSSSCHHGRQRPAVDTASGPAESFPWRMRKRQHRRWGRPQPLSRAQSTSGRVVSRRRETPPTTTALTADHHRSPHR